MANGTAPTTGDLLEVPSGISRLRYFFGQLLTQRDLVAEQGYHLLLRRLFQREALGTGTVSGLRVDTGGPDNPDCVFVRAGLALDPDGREILSPSDVCVRVADTPLTPSAASAYVTTPYTRAHVASQVAAYWGASFGVVSGTIDDVAALSAALTAHAPPGSTVDDPTGDDFPFTAGLLNKLSLPSGFTLPLGMTLREYLFNAIVGTTYLGVRYVERAKEPAPAVLDASCCGGATCFPSRTEEGAMIVGQTTPFGAIQDPYQGALAVIEHHLLAEENAEGLSPGGTPYPHDTEAGLYDFILGAFRGLPPSDEPCGPKTPPVVPIAQAHWGRFPNELPNMSRITTIDNRAFRPLAPGVPVVRAMVTAFTQGMTPRFTQPHFDLLSPVERGALTVPSGASSVIVRARSTSPLDATALNQATWQIDFYAATGSAPQRWDTANQPGASAVPYAFTVTAAVSVQEDGTYVDLTLTSVPPNTPLVLPSGTYVWRLNVDNTVRSLIQHAVMDGLPRPPNVVPTGDLNPTTNAPLEAVFYVP